MIKTFKHKGLENFFNTVSKAGIQPKHELKISIILDTLDAAEKIEDMNLPAFKLHCLSGKNKTFILFG